MSESITIHLADLRKLKYCVGGSKLFFEKNGLDWRDFAKNGISSDILEATGDAMAMKLVEEVRGR